MQYGPRGAPETAVVRVVEMPAASRATATLSPSRAGMSRLPNRMVSVAGVTRTS